MVELLKSRPHIFDSIQVAFLLTDAHSSILYANQSAEDLFGYSRNEIEGKRVRILFLDDDLLYLLPNIIYLSLYQDGFKGELLLKQRDGNEIFVHLFTTCFKEREETYITFTFQEIQRLKSLERKRLEDEHWTTRAHGGRDCPSGPKSDRFHRRICESSLEGCHSPSKDRSYLTRLLEEACRLERMIQPLETYIQISNPSFRKEKVQDVAEEVLRIFSRKISVKRISVNLEAGGIKGEGIFFIDREWVTQALLNLLENSLEAVTGMPKKERPVLSSPFSRERRTLEYLSLTMGRGFKRRTLDSSSSLSLRLTPSVSVWDCHS